MIKLHKTYVYDNRNLPKKSTFILRGLLLSNTHNFQFSLSINKCDIYKFWHISSSFYQYNWFRMKFMRTYLNNSTNFNHCCIYHCLYTKKRNHLIFGIVVINKICSQFFLTRRELMLPYV